MSRPAASRLSGQPAPSPGPYRTRIPRSRAAAIVLTLVSLTAPLAADDLTGAERFLCTAVEVTACYDDGECLSLPPWELNIPQFIEVDLDARTLATTEASGQDRSTPIRNLEREEGRIVLQGFENGRAFSFLITEKTGAASIAVAREGMAVAVFGACTPMPED